MKFLFVESYPHVFLGQQRTLISILDEASSCDHECIVAVTSEGEYVDELRRREYEVLMLSYPEKLSSYGGAIYQYKGINKLKCYRQGLQYIWGIRRTLKQENPDVIYCNDMRGLLTVGVAARTLGIPVVIWDKLDKPHGWLDHLQLPLVAKNIIISDAVCSKYPTYQLKCFNSKIIKVHEGVEAQKAECIRETLPGELDDIYIAIVGSISQRKGHDRLISIWSELLQSVPKLRLLVIGEASDKESQNFKEKYFSSSLERVHLLGMREDVGSLMESIDFLVVPSRYEGFGMVIVEAMAANKAVIGARAGGIPEVIVDGETGLLFDGEDANQLKNCVLKLASNERLRDSMGKAGGVRVQEYFNRSLQMRKIVDLLESLSKKNGKN